jgi:diguanylate cyclase (GGDEF)-like protein
MNRHLPADRETRFRASLLLGVLLAIVALGISVFLFFWLFADFQMEVSTRYWSLQLIAVSTLCYVALMLALLRGHYRIASLGTVAAALLSVGAAVVLTSGAPLSPALPLLLMPAVIGYCLLGPRAGSLIAVLIPLIVAAQWSALAVWYWRLPALQSHKNPTLDAVLINSFNYVVVIIVLVVYERINSKLREERDAERQRLAHFATHDELTGLANRRHFLQRLEEACARCDRGAAPLAVLYLDLDGFKKINDAQGHHAGDMVLLEIARRLKATLRRQDLVARLGGDEFAVIMDTFNSSDEIEELCQRVRIAIRSPIIVGGCAHRLGTSIGVAIYPGDVTDADHVLRHADAAMYAMKRRQSGESA